MINLVVRSRPKVPPTSYKRKLGVPWERVWETGKASGSIYPLNYPHSVICQYNL